MKKSITIVSACLITSLCFAQNPKLLKVTLVLQFNTDVADFTTDNLANIYLLTPGNQIKKVNDKGDSVAVYNDVRRYGKISYIDATNPLKVLVYYREFSTIVVLDRLLNVRTTIDLRRKNILQASVIATSYDNYIWVYDELENRIKKIDDNGNVLLQFVDFRQIFDAVPTPVAMFDRDGQLYLYDTSKGLIVFDYYGAQKNNFQLLHLADVEVHDKNTITARGNNHLVVYKPATLQLLSFTAFPDQCIFKKISLNGNTLYCLTKTNQLQVYKVLK